MLEWLLPNPSEDEPTQLSPFEKAGVRGIFTSNFFLLLFKQFSIIYLIIYLCYMNADLHEYVKRRVVLWLCLCCLFVVFPVVCPLELSHESTLEAIENFGYSITAGLALTGLILITNSMSPFLAANQSSILCMSFVLYLSFPKTELNMAIVFRLWVAVTLLYGSFAYTNRSRLDLWSDCVIASVSVLLCSLFIFSCVRSMTYDEYFYSVEPNEFLYPSVIPIPFALLPPTASIALFYIVKHSIHYTLGE